MAEGRNQLLNVDEFRRDCVLPLQRIIKILDGDPDQDAPGLRARVRKIDDEFSALYQEWPRIRALVLKIDTDLEPVRGIFNHPEHMKELSALLKARQQMKWIMVGLALNLAGIGTLATLVLRVLGGN